MVSGVVVFECVFSVCSGEFGVGVVDEIGWTVCLWIGVTGLVMRCLCCRCLKWPGGVLSWMGRSDGSGSKEVVGRSDEDE